MWTEACEQVAMLNLHEQLKEQVAADETLAGIIAFGERISVAIDLPSLSQAINEILPSIGVPTAILSRCVNGVADELEVFVALYQGVPQTLSNWKYPARRLLPSGVLSRTRRHSLLVSPTVFDTEHLGIAIFEYTADRQGYQMLRDQIAIALRSLAMHQAVVEQTKQHERSLQAQEREAAAARMQALSVLAGGVAHDINNALGSLVALPDITCFVYSKRSIKGNKPRKNCVAISRASSFPHFAPPKPSRTY